MNNSDNLVALINDISYSNNTNHITLDYINSIIENKENIPPELFI
jgi:hypothetical protein